LLIAGQIARSDNSFFASPTLTSFRFEEASGGRLNAKG